MEQQGFWKGKLKKNEKLIIILVVVGLLLPPPPYKTEEQVEVAVQNDVERVDEAQEEMIAQSDLDKAQRVEEALDQYLPGIVCWGDSLTAGYGGEGVSYPSTLSKLVNENIIDVPLLGKVTAGTPIEAIETPDEYFSLPANLVNSKNEVFTLKVSGESMINVGIYDGDILIVEKRNTARNGETVVAMNSDGEATVKTFYKENGYFRLQPENDTMDPIILNEVTILGKVIGLYRKL